MRRLFRFADQHVGAAVEYCEYLRCSVRRCHKTVRLLVPAEIGWSSQGRIKSRVLRGHQVAMLAEGHGATLTEPILGVLNAAGAKAIVPPEGHGVGVERYGRQFRIPAITLGVAKQR